MTGILDEKNEELGSVDHFAPERMEIGETTASTEGVAHFPQHKLMPMLWENALEKAKKRRENDDDDDDEDAFVRGDEVVRVERVMRSRSEKSSSSGRGGSNDRCRVTLKSGKVFEAKYGPPEIHRLRPLRGRQPLRLHGWRSLHRLRQTRRKWFLALLR